MNLTGYWLQCIYLFIVTLKALAGITKGVDIVIQYQKRNNYNTKKLKTTNKRGYTF